METPSTAAQRLAQGRIITDLFGVCSTFDLNLRATIKSHGNDISRTEMQYSAETLRILRGNCGLRKCAGQRHSEHIAAEYCFFNFTLFNIKLHKKYVIYLFVVINFLVYFFGMGTLLRCK